MNDRGQTELDLRQEDAVHMQEIPVEDVILVATSSTTRDKSIVSFGTSKTARGENKVFAHPATTATLRSDNFNYCNFWAIFLKSRSSLASFFFWGFGPM
jgi:hypothetical protein